LLSAYSKLNESANPQKADIASFLSLNNLWDVLSEFASLLGFFLMHQMQGLMAKGRKGGI